MRNLELVKISSLESDLSRRVVEELKLRQGHSSELGNFGGQPVDVIFMSSEQYPHSLHDMYFANDRMQQFHKHPGARFLIVLASSLATIDYCEGRSTPDEAIRRLTLGPSEIGAIRILPETWHRFGVEAGGVGVFAYSFHPSDEADLANAKRTTIMEELTTFWEGQVAQPRT